jgi:hypothetical protein
MSALMQCTLTFSRKDLFHVIPPLGFISSLDRRDPYSRGYGLDFLNTRISLHVRRGSLVVKALSYKPEGRGSKLDEMN